MKWIKTAITAAVVFTAGQSHSEDIELFVGNTQVQFNTKPQVLIIFDNSGSMRGEIETTSGYLPMCNEVDEGTDCREEPYPVVSEFDNSLNEDFVYFTVGSGIDGELPRTDKNSDTKRFNSPVNGCDAARESLAKYGFYTGYIREHKFKGNTGSWVTLEENSGANTIAALDCLDDVLNENGDNTGLEFKIGNKTYKSSSDSIAQGVPLNGATKNNKQFYSGSKTPSEADINAATNVFSGGEVVTLYHPNYLRWYHAQEKETVNRRKLDVAKDAVTTVLNATPIVDFSLMIFNLNHYGENVRDGGRVIAAFGQENTEIINSVAGIEAETNTPLCETLYEAYRFFAGKSVMYGDDDTNCNQNSCGFQYQGNTPAFDTSVVNGSNYISPFKKGCARNVYVIMITDGVPTVDFAADDEISSMIQETSGSENPTSADKFTDPNNNHFPSYLPNLAHWMKHNDINADVDGKQTSTLFTIGFGESVDDAEALLDEAAKQGGGKYFPARSAIGLARSFQAALSEILQINTTFTAPSVAANNTDRTRSLDSVYFSMFYPEAGARWQGNIKKLKVSGDTLVDKTNKSAIDEDGNISEEAKTFWLPNGADADGNDTKKGGVNSALTSMNLAQRKVLTDGSSGLVSLSESAVTAHYDSASAAASDMGVDETELTNTLAWAIGYDIDDDDGDTLTNDNRSDIMGDPLHSRPLTLNYGDGVVRILVGTNAGFLHLFKDSGDTVEEEWSYIPKELYSNLGKLRYNTVGDKVYGIDGSPVVHIKDNNGNGIIDTGDKVWAFVGMRRGGSSYYAFDISDPNSPKLMWKLHATDPGFEELGQSWSRPKVTYVNINGAKGEPVLIFGAGYDTNKDLQTGYSSDSIGRGLFMVKAEDKTLLWKATPAATSASAKNTQFLGSDSIPGEIATLDTDYDGQTDRLYASDTGGNVWRFDLPGPDPFASDSEWSSYQLADLSSNVGSGDRRFFYQPQVVRTYFSKVTETTVTSPDGQSQKLIQREDTPYEAVLVGSGNRSHPTEKNVNDALYMIRDENTITRSYSDTMDHPQIIYTSDLLDISNDPFYQSKNNQDAFLQNELTLAGKKGWYFGLSGAEKSLSPATVVGGIAYFSTFTPSEKNNLEQCELAGGGGKLYAFHLHYGAKIYNQLSYDVGNRVPDTPQLFFGEDEDGESQFLLVGVGSGEDGKGIVKARSIAETPVPPTCSDGNINFEGCGKDGDGENNTNFGFKTHRSHVFVEEGGN